MDFNEYKYLSHWRVKSTLEEITEVLWDWEQLPRWWSGGYLDAKLVKRGDPETNLGTVVRMYTKGIYAWTLKWDVEICEINHPYGFTIKSSGDFTGLGVWRFEQNGEYVDMYFDWNIRFEKPPLKWLAILPIVKPMMGFNHVWLMEQGENGLKVELQHRHAKSMAERAKIQPYPRPTTNSWLPTIIMWLLYIWAPMKARRGHISWSGAFLLMAVLPIVWYYVSYMLPVSVQPLEVPDAPFNKA